MGDRAWGSTSTTLDGPSEDEAGSFSQDYVLRATEAEQESFRQAADCLRQEGQIFVRPNGEEDPDSATPLSGTALAAVKRVVAYLSEGLAVRVEPYTELLTTSKAAALLGVSRPTVVRLLETNRLRGEPTGAEPGAHRRVRLDEVLRYRQQLKDDAAVLDEADED